MNYLWIIPGVIIFVIVITLQHLASKAGRRSIQKKIQERICPFDKSYCSVLGKSMTDTYVTKVCKNCPRYVNNIKSNLKTKNKC